MKLRERKQRLDDLVKADPTLLDLDIYTHKDDIEWLCYKEVKYMPTIMLATDDPTYDDMYFDTEVETFDERWLTNNEHNILVLN